MKTIRCSDGKGALAVQDCLACAVTSPRKHPPCGFDYTVLRSIFGAGEERPDIHVTDLTSCLKRAYLSKRQAGRAPQYVHALLPLMLGLAVHGHLEESDVHVESEKALSAGGITGRADVVYNGGQARIVDIKSTRWLYPDKLPYSSHALQVNVYAHLARQLGLEVGSLAVQYIDMSGPTKCRRCKLPVVKQGGELVCPSCGNAPSGAHLGAVLVEIPMMAESEIAAWVEERRSALQAALDMDLPPLGEPSFLCGYCQFNTLCEEAQI